MKSIPFLPLTGLLLQGFALLTCFQFVAHSE